SHSSTLFPYTTLFRSEMRSLIAEIALELPANGLTNLGHVPANVLPLAAYPPRPVSTEKSVRCSAKRQPAASFNSARLAISRSRRSEEHTSELQSRFDL